MLLRRCDLVVKHVGIAGPNVNNVEKLAELRRAGVNIGTSRLIYLCLVLPTLIVDDAYSQFA